MNYLRLLIVIFFSNILGASAQDSLYKNISDFKEIPYTFEDAIHIIVNEKEEPMEGFSHFIPKLPVTLSFYDHNLYQHNNFYDKLGFDETIITDVFKSLLKDIIKIKMIDSNYGEVNNYIEVVFEHNLVNPFSGQNVVSKIECKFSLVNGTEIDILKDPDFE